MADDAKLRKRAAQSCNVEVLVVKNTMLRLAAVKETGLAGLADVLKETHRAAVSRRTHRSRPHPEQVCGGLQGQVLFEERLWRARFSMRPGLPPLPK